MANLPWFKLHLTADKHSMDYIIESPPYTTIRDLKYAAVKLYGIPYSMIRIINGVCRNDDEKAYDMANNVFIVHVSRSTEFCRFYSDADVSTYRENILAGINLMNEKLAYLHNPRVMLSEPMRNDIWSGLQILSRRLIWKAEKINDRETIVILENMI